MKKVLVVIITFIIICISIWFQTEFLNSIPMMWTIANFGIVLVSGIGLISGKFLGGIIGAIYGILIDVAFGSSIGINTALYAMCGIISGILNNSFSKGNKISMVMLVLICTVLFEFIAYILNVILNGFELNISVLILKLILESAYNMLLTIIFFNPISFWGDILNKTKNSYYLL